MKLNIKIGIHCHNYKYRSWLWSINIDHDLWDDKKIKKSLTNFVLFFTGNLNLCGQVENTNGKYEVEKQVSNLGI